MTKKILLLIFVITLAVFAGVFSASAYAQSESLQPWNVILEVEYNGDVFTYDLAKEISRYPQEAENRAFYLGSYGKRQKFAELLAMGLDYGAVCEYVFPNFLQTAKHFSYVERKRADSVVTFGKNGFKYSAHTDGVAVDVKKLVDFAFASGGKKLKVKLPLVIDKAVTERDLKANTVLKGKFTTSFNSSGENRCHNIATAVNALNGTTVNAGETFSFNAAVGERSEKNGYKTSKIIMDGEYTDGIGGGVCQVSTTLYNALLLSEFIPKATQHTLVSSYVMTGFDAMVSYGSADLTFVNVTEHPVYIGAYVSGKSVTFCVYGEPNEYKVVRENCEEREPYKTVVVCDEKKYPELVYDDQYKVVRNGSDGVKSKSYLLYYKNGKLIEKRLIRSNVYKKVDKIVACGKIPREQADGASQNESLPTATGTLPDCGSVFFAVLPYYSFTRAFTFALQKI